MVLWSGDGRDLPMRFVTLQDLETGSAYWRYSAPNRWEYLSVAIAQLKAWNVKTMLEIGTAGLPISPDSDTMDMDAAMKPKILHDVTVVPWPIKTKAYDVVLATQVWEHLGTSQAKAFGEVMRVARRAILSFPYGWLCQDVVHRGIGDKKIGEWTLGVPPESKMITKAPGRRAVLMWTFR